MYEDFAIIFAGISALAAAAGLFFNGWTQSQQSKSNYYNVFKEIEEEYNDIDKRSLDLKEYVTLNDSELMKQSDEIINKTRQFKRDHVEFHEKLAHLYYKKIIPKNILEYFNLTFSHACFYVETSDKKEKIKKQINNLIKWCDDNNIKPKNPFDNGH